MGRTPWSYKKQQPCLWQKTMKQDLLGRALVDLIQGILIGMPPLHRQNWNLIFIEGN